jgi:hypothetical protein
MPVTFTVPALELGVERATNERLSRALGRLQESDFALLRSPSGYRAFSRPEFEELFAKMRSPGHVVHITDPDPIEAHWEKIIPRIHDLAPLRHRVISVHGSGLEIAHDPEIIPTIDMALAGLAVLPGNVQASSLAGGIYPPIFVLPGGSGGAGEPRRCPELRPFERPANQPYLERAHTFYHLQSYSFCLKADAECTHPRLQRFHGHCGRCGS